MREEMGARKYVVSGRVRWLEQNVARDVQVVWSGWTRYHCREDDAVDQKGGNMTISFLQSVRSSRTVQACITTPSSRGRLVHDFTRLHQTSPQEGFPSQRMYTGDSGTRIHGVGAVILGSSKHALHRRPKCPAPQTRTTPRQTPPHRPRHPQSISHLLTPHPSSRSSPTSAHTPSLRPLRIRPIVPQINIPWHRPLPTKTTS